MLRMGKVCLPAWDIHDGFDNVDEVFSLFRMGRVCLPTWDVHDVCENVEVFSLLRM